MEVVHVMGDWIAMRNRIKDYWPDRRKPFGTDGDSLLAGKRSATTVDAPKGTPTDVAESTPSRKPPSAKALRIAATMTTAIEDRWHEAENKLAIAAKISTAALTLLKTRGAEGPSTVLKKVCTVLRLDVQAVLAGRIADAKAPNVSKRTDLHAMLDSLIGTADEPHVERLLRALAGKH